MTRPVRVGLGASAQFALLVALNALVGAMVGLERTVLPLIGKDDSPWGSSSAFGCSRRLREPRST